MVCGGITHLFIETGNEEESREESVLIRLNE